MATIRFTIDSALLRELGERLVGKSHIALAELLKNSYDADATDVVVRFGEDFIEVIDNGHGMDFKAFKNFWMRIGTTHKTADKFSPKFKRSLTGSKGVGRLAVQFLGDRVEIRTAVRKDPKYELVAEVDWKASIAVGDLTKAEAVYNLARRETVFPEHAPQGTHIRISGLKQAWGDSDFEELAREVWTLQPPFGKSLAGRDGPFRISLETPNAVQVAAFDRQMRAILSLWHARILGRFQRADQSDARPVSEAKGEISIQFAGYDPRSYTYEIPGALLHSAEFEIYIFNLANRQPHGIKVQDARAYLDRFGGIRVYDSGFHLPYYGSKEADWLQTEQDHSHRLSASKLLPASLQISHGMNFLPTRSRILGGVNVNTNLEAREASGSDCLTIQVTRDRLVSNNAYTQLKNFVRYALDLYAMEEARRSFAESASSMPIEPLTATVRTLEGVLESYREKIPDPIFSSLSQQVSRAARASEAQEREVQAHIGLLGTLATAGIAALGYQHELTKQLRILGSIRERLSRLSRSSGADEQLVQVVTEIDSWIERATQTRALFLPLLSEEDRESRARLRLRPFLENLQTSIAPFLRGIAVDLSGTNPQVRLPLGTLAEWFAIFQNVFTNAANAMLDADSRVIGVTSTASGRTQRVLVMDTGAGVDLSTSEELFEPFVRKLTTTEERRRLALGGTGLGLTIVRMIAHQLGCKVSFAVPSPPFKTAFCLEWREAD